VMAWRASGPSAVFDFLFRGQSVTFKYGAKSRREDAVCHPEKYNSTGALVFILIT